MATKGGQNVLKNRRAKGRHSLSASNEIIADKTKRFSRSR